MSFPVEQDVLRREMEGQMTEEERMVRNIIDDYFFSLLLAWLKLLNKLKRSIQQNQQTALSRS